MLNSEKPIIWAIDALYSKNIDKTRAVGLINKWKAETGAPVEPVFVSNDIRLEKSWDHPDARKVLKDVDEQVRNGAFMAPRIIKNIDPPYTVRKQVHALLEHAKKVGAQLIVVHSTNKPAHVRMMLGSFAETLIHSSTVPVLLLGADTETPKSLNKILFATDFSNDSFAAFQKVIEKARQLNAEVLLFHQSESHFGFPEGLQEQGAKSEQAERWLQHAFSKEVRADIIMSEESVNKGEGILNAASKYSADIVALVAKSGPVGRALLGSATNHVARRADLPVLILYPEAAES